MLEHFRFKSSHPSGGAIRQLPESPACCKIQDRQNGSKSGEDLAWILTHFLLRKLSGLNPAEISFTKIVNEIEGEIGITQTFVGDDANFKIGAGYFKIWV